MANIIDLGFDVNKLTQEQIAIVNSLNLIYDSAKRLDGLKISFGNAGGFGDLQKGITQQKTAIDQLESSVKKYGDTEARVAKERERAMDKYYQQLSKEEEAGLKKFAAEETRHKTVISNSQAEVKAYQNTINGQKNITTTINKTQEAYDKAAVKAIEWGKTTNNAVTKTNVSLKVTYGIIETLTSRAAGLRDALIFATDEKKIATLNNQLLVTEAELTRLGNLGKEGFDEMGMAIGRTGNGLRRSFGLLRQVAYILPGIGIAGIFNLGFEALGGLVSKLEVFNKKLVETENIQASIIKTRMGGIQSAQEELVIADQLMKASQNKNISLDQQYKAYKMLQDKYPDYLANLTKEEFQTKNTADNYKLLKDAIIAKALAQANETEIAKRAVQNQQLQFDNEARDQALKRLNNSNNQLGSSAGTYNAKTGALDVQVTSRATAQIAQNNKEIADHFEKQADNSKKIAVNEAIIKGLSGDITNLYTNNGVKILGDDKDLDNKAKKVRTIKDVFKELEIELTKIDENITGTFGENDKDRINAYNKALGNLIEIGVKPGSDAIEKFKSHILALSDVTEKAKGKNGGLAGVASQFITDFEITNKLSKESQDKLAENQKKRSKQYKDERRADLFETLQFAVDIETKTSDIIKSLSDARFEREKNQIAELESLQQSAFDAESKRIRESSLSDAEKADQLSILENRRATEKEANARKEKQVAIEQAKFDQKMAAFQVFIQTLLTVAKLGFVTPAAILAGIAGAAAEVAILAKEIPKYAEGTLNHPGGRAIVGEGKYKERVNLPGGKSFIADHAMLMDLPAGTSVEPLKGDYMNEALNHSLIRGMVYTNSLTGMMERKHGDQAWKIALWQTSQLKKALTGRKPVINVKVYNDSGHNDYINNQVFK